MSPPAPQTLALVLAPRRDALEPARQQVLAFLAPHRLPPRVVRDVELALEETLMNAAMHGFPDGAGPPLDLRLRVDPDEVVLAFADAGIAFDPRAHAPAPPPSKLAQAPVGGLGLKLLRARARRIDYHRVGDRNELTIGIARR
jgi:anti-sigma regulatory factor (Ser/Thr protein kinase)